MLNDRLAAAQLIQEKLYAAEAAIDEALARASELTAAVPVARRRANIAATVGQDAIALSVEAITALVDARAKLVAAHGAYADVRDEMGLRTRMSGDAWKVAPPSFHDVSVVTCKAA